MGFEQFLGNERIVTSLRGMLATERVPSAIAFLGPKGIGKYTLARMFAQAANCEQMRDDFCGECETCKRIALLAEPFQSAFTSRSAIEATRGVCALLVPATRIASLSEAPRREKRTLPELLTRSITFASETNRPPKTSARVSSMCS